MTSAPVHLALVYERDTAAELVSRVSDTSPVLEQPRVGLTRFDRLPLETLSDDPHALASWVADSATALAGADREAARLRLISRAVATERARHVVLEAMLDERLAARDFEGVHAVNRVLTSTTKRLCALLREHAAACSIGQRASVVIGQAVVHVEAAK